MATALFSFFRSLFTSRRRATPRRTSCASGTSRPLRVVDKGQGRMVISGRMADVCAELERLAAQEARAPAR